MAPDTLLQVVTSTDRRGAEKFAVDLHAELAERGWTVETVALRKGETSGFALPVLGDRALSLPTLRALRHTARRADVVVAHGSTTLPACAIGLAGSRTPFVYRNIGDPRFWASTLPRRVRTAAFMHRARAVAALDDDARTALEQCYRIRPSRITAIPTGVSAADNQPATPEARSEARRRLDIGPDARVALVVGALSPEKGVDVAIDAVARVPGLELVIVGNGEERDALESRAARHPTTRIRFLGALADPSDAFSAADLLILSSHTEGLPAVLIEAGMRGLPVVATDVGYVRSIVVDGVSGILCRSADAEALSAGIEHVLRSGECMGREARAHCVAAFDLRAVADRWDALLRSVIGRSAVAPQPLRNPGERS